MATLDLITLTQILIAGALTGTLYAPLTLGFNIIYRSSRVVNFAQGELLLIGAYVAYTFTVLVASNLIIGLMLAIIATGLVGPLIERAVLRPLLARPVFAAILVTIGLGISLQGTSQLIWGVTPLAAPVSFPAEPIRIGPIILPSVSVYSALVSTILVSVLLLFYQKTKLGLSMRAAGEDQALAMALGVNVRTVIATAWTISAVSSTVAGVLLSGVFGFVSYYLLFVALRVYVAAIVGGLDSVGGAILGSILIGVGESIGGLLEPSVGPGFRDAFPLLLALIVMMIRPYGLLGTERIERI
ncbi:MAG: branched-chain amino acid ABC transporter permease [Thaumarchaeota archaeon]|nr:branched-chain amino acid ABC transporter permease [Candidatus Calditenuaceae archaeon]MDW8043168.1 branched-chain amino acid ABC transporter permease [Nitrososphaerota archaeon]